MNRRTFIRIAAGGVLAAPALVPRRVAAARKLQVVTSIPDLADLARQVGGDLVDVKSLASGVEDIHAVPMRPSFAVLLSRADALLMLGLEAEHGFLPGLIEASRNTRIQRDGPGYIDCSTYVTPLDVPTRIDRALGDIHPMGNPHFNLDPVMGKNIVRAIVDGLSRLAPDGAATFRNNAATYTGKLEEATVRWLRDAAPLKGKKLVSYHADMAYFVQRFGMEQFGTIEIRPGIDPTPAHIADLQERMKQARVDIVVRELHYPVALAQTLAKQTGARLVEIAIMVGAAPQAKDYISFVDYNVRAMLKAVTGG